MLLGVRFPSDLLGGGFQGDVGDVQIISSSGAFAFLKPDGSVMALGDADAGGDCSAVQAIFFHARCQKMNVKHMHVYLESTYEPV